MTEQIYINGVLMEQSAGSPASLVWQSPFFTDIDNITSNRSNSVDFPVTRNNLAAIDNCHLAGVSSVYAYRRHRVLYYRDGVQIFAGYATLLSITPTAIKFSFTWGSVEAFQTLLDLNLRDLTGETTHVTWESGKMGSYENGNILWGAAGVEYTPHPVMPVSEVLAAMQEASGVTFTNPKIFNDYVIPLVTKDADETAKIENGVRITVGNTDTFLTLTVTADTPQGRNRWNCLAPDEDTDTDRSQLYLGDGLYDVSDIDELKVVVKEWDFKTLKTNNVLSQVISLSVCAMTEDGTSGTEIGYVKAIYYKDDDEGYHFYRVEEETELTFDVEDYSYIALRVNYGSASTANAILKAVIQSVDICLYDNGDQDVQPGSQFPLYGNLPDWTCSQLLKNLMKLEGVFPLVHSATEVEFISIDALYSNRFAAPDWTAKAALTGGMAEELSTALDGYARKNTCKWADDDTVTGDYAGEIDVDDETLDKEAELITMDFAATDTRSNGKVMIRSYSIDEGDDDEEVQFDEVEPRILKLASTGDAVFDGLDWPSILKNKYAKYVNVVNRPRLLTVQVLLTAPDLAALDLTVPVYLRQFGHYYAIRELTTKDATLAEAKLLELKCIEYETDTVADDSSEDVEGVSGETYEGNGLTVLQDADGNWYATLTDRNDSRIKALNLTGKYKVCLMRYGYTRRGKRIITYISERDAKSTKTDRKKFRVYRFGLRWRVIGEHLLRYGRVSPTSQVVTSEVYSGATLVFNLLDPITLPSAANTKRYMTRDGHITNRDKDGLSELYIGLFHNGENGWELVSNKVQVRGRNAAKSRMWDFDENNVVMGE